MTSGTIRFNNADLTLSTQMYVHYLTEFNKDFQRMISLFPTHSRIIIQDKTTANYILYNINDLIVRTANQFITIPIQVVQNINQASLTNNLSVYLINQSGTIGLDGPQGPAGTNATNTNFSSSVTSSGSGVTPAVSLTGTYPNLSLGFALKNGTDGTNGTNGTNATNPNFSASVTSSGTGVTPAVTLTGTYPNLSLGFALKNGADGATGPAGADGTSAEMEYTFTQVGYYGTLPTFGVTNGATGIVLQGGGSVTIGTNTGINQLTKTYHVRSNTASVATGQSSGWYGASIFPFFFVGQGFKVSYSFGLLDTTTNAATRTMIGFGNFNSFTTLNNTITVQSVANQFIGIIQESGDNFFSFYSKGPGASGITPIVSTVTCGTTNTGWYTVTFHNNVNSNDVLITLKYVAGGAVTTATQTITCGASNTLSTSQACYPIMQRAMASAGGTTGSAILALNSMKFYTR
jgi:hypothetical protein